ncbi:MAG: endonuclease/exonuclease/phosphatase family protein [Bryobacteraceae bacterium]
MLVRIATAILPVLFFNPLSFGQTKIGAKRPHLVRFQVPHTLPFDDLVTLASVDPPPAALQARLNTLLTEPFISNEAALDGVDPKRPAVPRVGRVVRIAEWNINRLEKRSMLLALGDVSGYEAYVGANPKLTLKKRERAIGEARGLEGADIVVLDEVDDGVKRSGYRNVPRDIARALHMNYAYGVEFVELNSIYLGVKKMDIPGGAEQESASEKFGVDPKRDLALEGSAILSRYPILSAKIVRLPQEYDWYHEEIGAIDELRKAEKWTAKKVFDERLKRQVRRGGRMMLVVKLAVPEASGGALTVVCPHLEDYTTPKGRRKQMDFVLRQIRGISGPLVVAGDMNTLDHDGTPATIKYTLVRRILLNYRFWMRQALYLVLPVPGLHYAFTAVNYFKNYHDPTAFSIPLILPNYSRWLFEDVRQFRFQDGGKLDWAGLKRASFQHRGRTLSDSNQREWKGFATSFAYRRTYHGLVGKYKIDWMFVKEPGRKGGNPKNNHPFRPYFGRTLCGVNTGPTNRISDHCPTTLDLSLQ